MRTGASPPSLDVAMRIGEAFNAPSTTSCSLTSPAAPCTRPRTPWGDRLSGVAELGEEDVVALANVIDGLVAKSRLRTLAGGISSARLLAPLDASFHAYSSIRPSTKRGIDP